MIKKFPRILVIFLFITSLSFSSFAQEEKDKIIVKDTMDFELNKINKKILLESISDIDINILDNSLFKCSSYQGLLLNSFGRYHFIEDNSRCDYSVLKKKITQKMLFEKAKITFNMMFKLELEKAFEKKDISLIYYIGKEIKKTTDYLFDFSIHLDEFGNLTEKKYLNESSQIYIIPDIVVLSIILQNEYGFTSKLNSDLVDFINKKLLEFGNIKDKDSLLKSQNELANRLLKEPEHDKITSFIINYANELKRIKDPNQNADLKEIINKFKEIEKENLRKANIAKKFQDKYIEKQFKLIKIPKEILLKDVDILGTPGISTPIFFLIELIGGNIKYEVVNDTSFIIRSNSKNLLTGKSMTISSVFELEDYYLNGVKNFDGKYMLTKTALNGKTLNLQEQGEFYFNLFLSKKNIDLRKELEGKN